MTEFKVGDTVDLAQPQPTGAGFFDSPPCGAFPRKVEKVDRYGWPMLDDTAWHPSRFVLVERRAEDSAIGKPCPCNPIIEDYSPKSDDTSNDPRCKSCGVAWRDHLGPERLCDDMRRAESGFANCIKEIQESYNKDRDEYEREIKRLQGVVDQLDEKMKLESRSFADDMQRVCMNLAIPEIVDAVRADRIDTPDNAINRSYQANRLINKLKATVAGGDTAMDQLEQRCEIAEQELAEAREAANLAETDAASMREVVELRLRSVTLVINEGRTRQPGNQYVADNVWYGWIRERQTLCELLNEEFPKHAGRDLVARHAAEIDDLKAKLAESERKIQQQYIAKHAAEIAEKDAEIVLLKRHWIEDDRDLIELIEENERLDRKWKKTKAALVETYRGKIDPSWFGEKPEPDAAYWRYPDFDWPRFRVTGNLVEKLEQNGGSISTTPAEWFEWQEGKGESLIRCTADGKPLDHVALIALRNGGAK